jgi:NADPH:quinone reductase-like Zn-dependent oxidoreductase
LRATVERVLGRIPDGTLGIRVGTRFTLAEAAQVHALVEGGTSTGKVVLTVSGTSTDAS